MKKLLWKAMAANLKSAHGNMAWEIGKWEKHSKPLEMCQSGFHASETVIHSMDYVNMENLGRVEVRGKYIKGSDKQCWSEMRIVKAWQWKKEDSVALAIYAAELVINIYEKKYSGDDRPRRGIEAAKEWLENPTEKNRVVARAASDVAWAAARAAASAAAWAASAAASDVARAAASAAAWAASDAAIAAASAAAWAASDAAAAASDAARAASDAAWAASAAASDVAWAAASNKILDQCEAWIQERIKMLAEIGRKE